MQLREAGIHIGRFDPDLMAQVEELNRDYFRLHKQPRKSTTGAPTKYVVRRWWRADRSDHYYTTEPKGEVAKLKTYADEGTCFRLFPSGTGGTTPLFQWFHSSRMDHFYTTDPTGEIAKSLGYKFQGILGQVALSELPGTVALYRWWNPTTLDHFYTTDPVGEIAPQIGYYFEGVSGYVRPASSR
jgi:hypothetical protein